MFPLWSAIERIKVSKFDFFFYSFYQFEFELLYENDIFLISVDICNSDSSYEIL